MRNKLKDIQKYKAKIKVIIIKKRTLKAYSRKMKGLQPGEQRSGFAGFLQLEFISVKWKYQLSRNLLIMFMNT